MQTVKMQTLLKRTLIIKEKTLNMYERCTNISRSVYLEAYLEKKLYNYIFLNFSSVQSIVQLSSCRVWRGVSNLYCKCRFSQDLPEERCRGGGGGGGGFFPLIMWQ